MFVRLELSSVVKIVILSVPGAFFMDEATERFTIVLIPNYNDNGRLCFWKFTVFESIRMCIDIRRSLFSFRT